MKILIANRACAAMRIIRCCQHLGLDYVTIHSLDDNSSLHVTSSANSVLLHPTSSTSLDTYLNVERILEICLDQACTAIHPGYGFLSENADFAQACADRGVVFIGPTPEQISSFGLKHTARALAVQFAVPVVPGTGLLYSLEEAETLALEIGYPVLLKCVAGGGGIGLHVCPTVEELRLGWDSVKRLAVRAFNNDGVFMEKYLAHSRHVEVQVFGDSLGHVVCLGDRDCTSQRRNQKVIEEAPAPDLPPLVREQMWQSALRLAKGVGYRSAGTVEYIVDNSTLDFYFLEVNTRVQVEHGVTEQITGVDLISWMIQTARGELDLSTYVLPPLEWHSIQCRIYAEDANKAFQPSSGLLSLVEFPNPTQECRVERWIQNGTVVSTQYDPMLGKLICRGRTRTEAIANLVQALRGTVIYGLESNLEFLSQLLMDARFTEFQSMSTHWLDEFTYRPSTIDVLEPGAQTTVQDFPGRVGYWFAGVPPSGPMDSLAFRLGNALVGNTPATRAAGLEICQGRVQLRFNVPCVIALTGCEFAAELDGVPIKFWESHSVASSQVLSLTNVHSNPGLRAYLCISNRGLAMADYLGSKSTFALGKLGGITLKHGDVLRVATTGGKDAALPKQQRIAFPPTYTSNWDLRVTVGPHSDFFTSAYFEHQFLQQTFEVHYNSNRLGIRLNAPSKPEFTRLDGGEAGLHPSNIHDVVYAVGSVNFTGDLPVILGPDGPSLGGFVCPVTICQADLWKTGQVKPGDKLRFCVTDFDHAREQELAMDLWISSGKCFAEALTVVDLPSTLAASILRQITVHDLLVVYRLAGDRNVLIEYGELKLDLRYRCRVYALEQHLQQFPISGVLEVSPGVRSVQIKFDSRLIESLEWLLDQLVLMEQSLPAAEEMEIPSRVVRLPLAFDASSTKLAISKYRQSVRDKAPWLPSNIDFIQRINGLTSSQQVSDVVFAANYLVLGLGDVYLGAPCAVPLDPRHRLQTTKYNPARTWTEEGEVGIGGVFMCIYGMQSPGGYQLVGRTVPVWNNHPQQRHHWLLQSFDQVQFYPVSESELLEIRSGIQAGRVKLDIQSTVFNVKDYLGFLECHEQDIAQFQRHQNEAFQLERALWAAQGVNEEEEQVEVKQECDLSNTVPVCAQISGSVWSVHVSEGDFVHKGDLLLVVEAMKLEVSVYALETGVINRVFVRPGTKLAPGDLLVGWEPKPTLPTGRLDFAVLRELYTKYSVTAVVLSLIQRLEEHADKPVFISRFTNDALVSRARALDQIKFEPLPLLFGVPFAVKDNIDVLGLPTTCACPAYSFLPECNATAVQLALDEGAICLGKTNMDQFAAGLVGVRSPHGIPASTYNSEYVSGGSSSGSAVSVALGLAAFSLGTDTAGSGRVPAMFNNLVGVKPSRGLLSNFGVVPACLSLDCVSIFATNLSDAKQVLGVLAKVDAKDAYSRPFAATVAPFPTKFTFGVPAEPKFFGDLECQRLFAQAVQRLEGMGGTAKPIPFDVFERAAKLLYGPWVAERLEALQSFFQAHPKDEGSIHPVTREIISGGSKFTAVELFSAMHELQQFRAQAVELMRGSDMLVVPTAPTHYTIDQVLANPIELNSNLGTYTNFVNLLDLAALAVPTQEFVPGSGMPFGITLIGRAMDDYRLLEAAERFTQHQTAELAVCGAHLSGMALNWQLVSRGCVLRSATRTACGKYELFALSPTRPGLIRRDNNGAFLEIEVWRFPNLASFGDFVANVIPHPLGVGKVETAEGEWVNSFTCEEYATRQAGVVNITAFGGWRRYKLHNAV